MTRQAICTSCPPPTLPPGGTYLEGASAMPDAFCMLPVKEGQSMGILLTKASRSHNYIGHNYAGHNYVGHNYVGRKYLCHNYVGHNFAGHMARPVQAITISVAVPLGRGQPRNPRLPIKQEESQKESADGKKREC